MKWYNPQLSQEIFNGDILDPTIEDTLREIAFEFYDGLVSDAPLEDIYLLGSMAGYNYTPYSDLDLHLVVDFSKVLSDWEITPDDYDLIKDYFDSQRRLWNEWHDILLGGHKVEVYVQDVAEENISGGVYSVLTEEWVEYPVFEEPVIDTEKVEMRVQEYVDRIDAISSSIKNSFETTESSADLRDVYDNAKKLKDEIVQNRRDALQTEAGMFAIDNLAFKTLRNTGKMGELITLLGKLHDEMYSRRA